jgi:hypothetical protein
LIVDLVVRHVDEEVGEESGVAPSTEEDKDSHDVSSN